VLKEEVDQMDTKYLGNIKINITTKNEILLEIKKKLINKDKVRLFFLNAHCYNLSQKNDEYGTNLNDAEYVLNDGIGVEIGAKILGFNFDENLNGTDLTPEILALAEKNGFKVYLLGGIPEVAEKAADNFLKKFPDLLIVGCTDGYFNDTDKVIKKINNTNPDILIVALGVPYQEKWISDNYSKINASLFMGVGAFLDFSSNRVKRAPEIFRKARMEWVYRLFIEPKRLWKRSLVGIPLFLYYIVKKKSSKRRKEL
jgi:N-acetylglucosaminyldiphosphoundecaprenol N-acetyl-beta-D-mannosaminyltransferase